MSDSFDVTKLIGMKLSDAEAYAKSFHKRRNVRPVKINGEPQMIFHSYDSYRTNVAISRTEAGDIITAYVDDG